MNTNMSSPVKYGPQTLIIPGLRALLLDFGLPPDAQLETCQDPKCRKAGVHLAHKWVDGQPLLPSTECYRVLDEHFRKEVGLQGIHLRPSFSLQPPLTSF